MTLRAICLFTLCSKAWDDPTFQGEPGLAKMIRRPLRPHFGHDDEKRLIAALKGAREWVIKCSSAAAPRIGAALAVPRVTRAIDELARSRHRG